MTPANMMTPVASNISALPADSTTTTVAEAVAVSASSVIVTADIESVNSTGMMMPPADASMAAQQQTDSLPSANLIHPEVAKSTASMDTASSTAEVMKQPSDRSDIDLDAVVSDSVKLTHATLSRPKSQHRPPSRLVLREMSQRSSSTDDVGSAAFESAEDFELRHTHVIAEAVAAAAVTQEHALLVPTADIHTSEAIAPSMQTMLSSETKQLEQAEPMQAAGHFKPASSNDATASPNAKKVPPPPAKPKPKPQESFLDINRAGSLHLSNEQMLYLLMSVKDGRLSVEEALREAEQQEKQARSTLATVTEPLTTPEQAQAPKATQATPSDANQASPQTKTPLVEPPEKHLVVCFALSYHFQADSHCAACTV